MSRNEHFEGMSLAGGGGSAVYVDKTTAQLLALSPAIGDTGYPTDGAPGLYLVCASAGTWQWVRPGFGPCSPSPASAWATTVDHPNPAIGAPGTVSFADIGPVGVLAAYGTVGATSRLRALPAAPYKITLGAYVTVQDTQGVGYAAGGLMFRESSSGLVRNWTLHEVGAGVDGGSRVIDNDSNWAYVAPVLDNLTRHYRPSTLYYEIEDDETDMILRLCSVDAVEPIRTVALDNATHNSGAWSPDQIGLWVYTVATTTVDARTSIGLWHYEEEA